MRYTTTVLLALIVIAAAVAIYVFRDDIFGEAPPAPEKPSAEKALVEDLEADDLTEVTLQQSDDEGELVTRLAAAKSGDQWRLTAPVAGRVDDYEVRRLARGALEATYRTTLEPGAKGQPSLADLGLDPPAYRLTLTGTKKTEDEDPAGEPVTVTVDIGRKAAVGDGLYVRLAGAEEVVMLGSDDLLTRARQRLQKYRDRNLVDLKRDDVVRMVLKTGDTTIRMDRAETPEGADPRWVLAEPTSARADPDAVSELLRTAVGLMAADFVADGIEDPSRYGLAKPRLVLTLYKEGLAPKADEEKEDDATKGEKKDEAPEPVKAVTLAFGGWADLKQEAVYARLDDADTVVSVEKRDFAKLDKTLADLRDRHVLALDKDRASEVAVDVPAGLAEGDQAVAYTLAKRDGTWHVDMKDRKEMRADSGAVDSLLKELDELKVLYFAEGDKAEAAKNFKAVGSVRVQMEKEAAPVGFEFGARKGDAPTLVRNIREDWVGRINEKDLEHLGKTGLAMLAKQVFDVDKDRVTRLAIRGPDRTSVFVKKDDTWTMTEPVEAEPKGGFVTDRLDDLADLSAEKVLAAATDFTPWNLEKGEIAVTVTLEPKTPAPAKAKGEAADATKAEPVEKTLILAHHEKAKVVGRVEGRDLVYELPLSLMKDFVTEPVGNDVIDLFSADVEQVEVVAGTRTVTLKKVDEAWFRTDARGRPEEEVEKDTVKGLIDAATALKASRWLVYADADPAAYGLDAPAVRVALTDKDDETVALLVSAKKVNAALGALFDESPQRYAMVDGGKRVALVVGKNVKTIVESAETLAPPKPKPKAKKPKAKPKPEAKSKANATPKSEQPKKGETPKPAEQSRR